MFFKIIFFIAVFIQTAITDVRARFFVSIFGGYSRGVIAIASGRYHQKFRDKLIEFRDEILSKEWEDYDPSLKLNSEVDYTSFINRVNLPDTEFYMYGFGKLVNGRWSFSSIKNKIERYLKYVRNEVVRRFPSSDGFSISEAKEVDFFYTEHDDSITFNKVSIPSVYLYNKYYPKFSAKILNRINALNDSFFTGDSKVIQAAITTAIAPNETEIIQAWDAATNPPAVKRNGLTLGLSLSYAKSLFPKISSKYGFYTGAECFAEFNPNASKSNGFSVKEHGFGIRPFAGIIKKGSWAVYGLVGVKCAKRKIQSEVFSSNKGSLSYELGVGTDYFLSDRFSVSAKFIKGMRTKVKMKGFNFQVSSTKILFSLNYHF